MALLIALGVALAAVVGMLVAYRITRVASPLRSEEFSDAYECGQVPRGSAWRAVPVGFLAFALAFLLFDVEIAFLLPWIGSEGPLRAEMKEAIVVFLVLLALGWVHVLRMRDFEWRR